MGRKGGEKVGNVLRAISKEKPIGGKRHFLQSNVITAEGLVERDRTS